MVKVLQEYLIDLCLPGVSNISLAISWRGKGSNPLNDSRNTQSPELKEGCIPLLDKTPLADVALNKEGRQYSIHRDSLSSLLFFFQCKSVLGYLMDHIIIFSRYRIYTPTWLVLNFILPFCFN